MSDDPSDTSGLDPLKDAGDAPFDPIDAVPGVTADKMQLGAEAAAEAAGEEGKALDAPIGGEATMAATSWGAATDEEMDKLD
jgi:hypothetical protein